VVRVHPAVPDNLLIVIIIYPSCRGSLPSHARRGTTEEPQKSNSSLTFEPGTLRGRTGDGLIPILRKADSLGIPKSPAT
jgi:hypothetical protein